MNPAWCAGKLEFDFSNARQVIKPDEIERTLSCSDFWAMYARTVWLIEVKDPEGTPLAHQPGEVKAALAIIRNDTLLKQHLLPKLYGAFAFLVETGREPRGLVRYGVVIGLSDLSAADRSMLANRVQRIIDRVGPKVRHSRHWPVVEVHTIASWNATHPHMQITRHP